MKKVFALVGFFLILWLNGFSQNNSADTSFIDVTEQYKIISMTKSQFQNLRKEWVYVFQIAILPMNSVGKKYIEWDDRIKPDKYDNNDSIKSRKEVIAFENTLLMCDKSKDPIWIKTAKTKSYCRRRGPAEPAMCSRYEVNYVSFKRGRHFIIMAFCIQWPNCGCAENKAQCEKESAERDLRIAGIFDEMVRDFAFEKVK